MAPGKTHVDEVRTDESLVARLLAAQFPRWADLPIRPVPSAGTDNALYRLGDRLLVRLPRIHWAVGDVDKESLWLPRLAPHLPLAIPHPLAMGKPAEGYPWHWGIYEWLEGENVAFQGLPDPDETAQRLAEFLTALRRIDATGGPHDCYRGKPLGTRDVLTRQAIDDLDGMIDADAAIAAWESALQAPQWDRAPVWYHGDMLPGNLLFQEGRLRAIIDFGALSVGDPACDLIIAWSYLRGSSRDVFREAMAVDDATWARGRGWALSIGLIILPYYKDTNPMLAGIGRRAVDQVLADHRASEGLSW